MEGECLLKENVKLIRIYRRERDPSSINVETEQFFLCQLEAV